ncbi:hypothetical protein NX794_01045 [Streptomyces sp. LP11]|uniref:Integral membrane protein n=1 Tax=Streptomyces pyxinicus TaxID=2970331 RepID=A0ABT2AUA6_9ACTN|nr:hypothetical protein [Streptomyces sp. LP11]MCS0599831.1 hypothetical protein [Streptomyces sp. LP11]
MTDRGSAHRDDSPAVALGPLAAVLGLVAAAGAWPTLMFLLLPWSLLAAGLAVAFGAMGVYYAEQGVGRLWTAVVGTALGLTGLVTCFLYFVVLAG